MECLIYRFFFIVDVAVL